MPPELATTIAMDEELDVSFERVDKINAPLLVVGLGGTGADAVCTIKDTLARRFKLPVTQDGKIIPVPPRTGYLVIDSDTNGQDRLDANEFLNIAQGVNVNALLKDELHQNLSSEQKRWVHHDLHEAGPEGGIGAGTYRAASRLMLDSKFSEVYNRLKNALRPLVVMNAGETGINGAAQIFIIAGIGGGTGSGTFLDVPQIIRHMMRSEPEFVGINYSLNAFIVMPDVTLSHVSASGATKMLPIIKRNSYAALKELDFWMDYDRHHTRYTMTYTGGKQIIWGKPYDHVTLMSGTNVSGNVFADSYKLIQRTIAENLLHYMANEQETKDDQGNATFSFLSYESNLHAQHDTSMQAMRLPVNHAYRAIGAYSKRIPRKKILYYEGSLLFKTFIPPRNEHGILVPNNELLLDGQSQKRFNEILRFPSPALYQQFANAAVYPRICADFSARNHTLVDTLRGVNPPIHQNFSRWQTEAIAPLARKHSDQYLEAAWTRFQEQCKAIMSDPVYGPFSLLQFLEDPSLGHRARFKQYAANEQSKISNLSAAVSQCGQACVSHYQTFLKPPMLNGTAAVQKYLDSLKELLDSVRQYEFACQYARVMDLLAKRVEAYIATALKPLCDLLVSLEQDFIAPENVVDSLGSDLVQASSLHGQINSIFADVNKDSKISRSFLGKLCDSTFETIPCVDTGSCGLTFVFRQNNPLNAMKILKEEMDGCFEVINSYSLQAIMDQAPDIQGLEGEALQAAMNQAIDRVAKSVVDSAAPLFSLADIGDKSNLTTHTAKQIYFSIPQDATEFLKRLSPDAAGHAPTINGVALTPKASSLTDHIFCNMTWDVLPLYSYTLMNELKQEYDAVIRAQNTSGRNSIHLVWSGIEGGDYRENWCLLPEPTPFYFFGEHSSSPAEDVEYNSVRKLVQRALDCGMLTIDSTVSVPTEFPEYKFRFFRNGSTHLDTASICGRLNNVLALRDPITGAPAAPDRLLSELQQLLSSTVPEIIRAAKCPTVMKNKLGIDETLTRINPNAENLDDAGKTEAAKNYQPLVQEYTVHILLQNPALLFNVQYQIEAFERIHAEMSKLTGMANAWEPRIAYAETFARLCAYDLVRFDQMGEPVFTNASKEVKPLIQPVLLREDLAHCKSVVKAIGAMADLDPNHDIRRNLEFNLRNAEQRWMQDSRTNALTREAIQQQIDRLNTLAGMASSERRSYLSTKETEVDADHALLDKYILLIKNAENYISAQLEKLERALKGSPVPVPVPVPDTWDCPCGQKGLTAKFCPECGTKGPELTASLTWDCPCGQKGLTAKFCPECGTRKP